MSTYDPYGTSYITLDSRFRSSPFIMLSFLSSQSSTYLCILVLCDSPRLLFNERSVRKLLTSTFYNSSLLYHSYITFSTDDSHSHSNLPGTTILTGTSNFCTLWEQLKTLTGISANNTLLKHYASRINSRATAGWVTYILTSQLHNCIPRDVLLSWYTLATDFLSLACSL